MNTYFFLISKSLKGQPKRAILTILSIALAVALMTAVSTMSASIQQTQINQAIAVSGDFHGTFNQLSSAQLETLKSDQSVQAVGISAPLGSVMTGETILSLEGFDETARDLMSLQLREGRFPQAEGEIALEGWMVDQMEPKPTVGEALSLEWLPFKASSSGEISSVRPVKGEFLLVGILENITQAQMVGVSLGLLSPETVEARIPGGEISYTAFVAAKGNADEIRSTLDRLRQQLGVAEKMASANEVLLAAMGAGKDARLSLALLASLLVTAASATIYNIFQISVVERTRQFGMLRAVGASPLQVCLLVMGEALTLSLAAIPLGLLMGLGAAVLAASTITLLESIISVLVMPIWAVAASGGTGLAATIFSALLPAVYAAKISPMMAIRNTGTSGSRHRRASEAFSRQAHTRSALGISGQMAYQNLWRSRLRSLVTIFSLGLGIMLFLLISAFGKGMEGGSIAEHFLSGDYALTVNNFERGGGYTEQTAQDVAALPGVEKVIKTRLDDFNYTWLPAGQVEPDLRSHLQAQNQREEGIEGIRDPEYVKAYSQVYGYDEDFLASLSENVVEGAIDLEALASGVEALVVDPDGNYGLKPGDELRIVNTAWKDGTGTGKEMVLRVGAILSEPPVHIGYSTVGPQVVLHEEVYKSLVGSNLYRRLDITTNQEADHAALEENLQSLAKSVNKGSFVSFEEVRAEFEKQKREIIMLEFALAAVVAVIGMVNIVNTLTTNLIVRTQEFGILRALGMTGEQLKGMTRLEGFFYGLFSAIVGGAGGIVSLWLLAALLAAEGSPIHLTIPWQGALLAVLFSTTIGVMATVSPTRRINRLSIIEAIRDIE